MASNDAIKNDGIKTNNENNDKSMNKELKIDRRPKRKKPGFHEEMFEETQYYYKKGIIVCLSLYHLVS